MTSTALAPDIYLRKLTPDWELETATYWGGASGDEVVALLADEQGGVTLVANTYSRDYPVSADALEAGRSSGRGLGITRFDRTGNTVLYSTTWGGSWAKDTFSARLLPGGGVLWCGSTYIGDLPALVEPAPRLSEGSRSAFVAGYDSAGDRWLPAYVFGGAYTVASDCAALPDGRWVATGITDDSAFPRIRSSLPSEGEGRRAFVSVIRH